MIILHFHLQPQFRNELFHILHIRMIFSKYVQPYHHIKSLFKIVTPLVRHSNCAKFDTLWRARSCKLCSFDCKLANNDRNHEKLVAVGPCRAPVVRYSTTVNCCIRCQGSVV